MLGTIVLREMQEYIKTTRFLIGLVLTVLLVTAVTSVNIIEYSARKQVYLDSTRTPDRNVVYREPQPLSIFAQGVELSCGEKKTLSVYSMLQEDTDTKGTDPFLLADFGFGTVDFLFIIKVVISLLVIFFAYDIVSGEKERGTLKLSLANNLPRWKLIFGKMASGLLLVALFLAVSLLAAALFVAFHPAIHFSAENWMRVLVIFGVSFLYLSFFFTLSGMVSIITNNAAASLLVLVQLWVMIVIILPGSGALLVQTLHSPKIMNEEETSKQIQAISLEYDKKAEALGVIDTNDKAYKRDTLRNEGNEAMVARVYLPRSNELTREAELIRKVVMLSPAGLYEQTALRLARTDFTEYDRFQKAVFMYWKTSSKERLDAIFRMVSSPGKASSIQEPSFTYRPENIGESLYDTNWNIFILFAWSLVFFISAHAAFLRKDVR